MTGNQIATHRPRVPGLHDIAAELAACRSPAKLDSCLAQFAQTKGVGGVLYQQLWTAEGTWSGRYCVGGCGPQLREHLDDIAAVGDPLNLLLAQQAARLDWTPRQPPPTGTPSRLAALAASDGLGYGHSLALAGPADLATFHVFNATSLDGTDRAQLAGDDASFWRELAEVVHATALTVLGHSRPRRDGRTVRPVLTPREREAVQHMVAGKTSGEIATAMRPRVSARTVDEYLAAAMRKLDVASRSQLSARVVALRVVAPG